MNELIPEKYRNSIPDGLIVEWAGRRKFYEVVEELGDAIWYMICAAWIFRVLVYFEAIDWNWKTQLALFLIGLVISLPAWLEVEKWLSEYHVVCRHSDKDGGVVYKFDGIINTQPQPINIAAGMDISTDTYKNNVFYWIWKKTTKNPMMRVKIQTASNVFLNNNRIDPGYYNAIQRVMHSPAPHRLNKDVPIIAQTDSLIRLGQTGWVDPDIVSNSATKLVRDIGGHNGLV